MVWHACMLLCTLCCRHGFSREMCLLVAVLQALLLATLERLEGVEAVVAAADATSAAMEDKASF